MFYEKSCRGVAGALVSAVSGRLIKNRTISNLLIIIKLKKGNMMPVINSIQKRFIRKSLVVAIMAVFYGASNTTLAQNDSELVEEEVLVTGFRASLEAALGKKREATGVVDAIHAEDIADFPDLNLAESLQRIPGVTISRVNGEGKSVTVRGLGSRYTQVKVNGMETRAGDQTSGRGFDFNMFASELFNSITVYKTQSANLTEGSLGATIELETARAMDYEEGSTFLISGKLGYNSNAEDTHPRLAGLYAYNDPQGKWGAAASIAYSEPSTTALSSNTIRWQKSRFRSVNGEDCSGTSAACDEVASAFHPRLPRFGQNDIKQERLGITAGLQIAPGDATEISFDLMAASLSRTRDWRAIQPMLRINPGTMDITSYVMEEHPDRYGIGNSTVIAADVNNTYIRSENYHQEVDSDYRQYTITFDHEFSDVVRMNALHGSSKNVSEQPVEITLMYDNKNYDGYRYDYSKDGKIPTLSFNGPSVSEPSTFWLSEIRDRQSGTNNRFAVNEMNFEWSVTDNLTLSTGLTQKRFEFDTTAQRRDNKTCVLDTVECDTDPDEEGEELYGAPGTAELSETVKYKGPTGSGTTTTWLAPSRKWLEAVNLASLPYIPRESDIRAVEEISTSAFIQVAGEYDLGAMRFLFDAGVRYAETEQTSQGFNSGSWVTIERPVYDDTLPSLNASLWVMEDLVIRAAWAEVMARPALGDLSPGGSVDAFNYGVSFKNPFLEPSRATNTDLSIEWYFSDEALLALAFFDKDIESFPKSETYTDTYESTGLPLSLLPVGSPAHDDPEASLWDISSRVNGEGAKVSGYELSFQLPLDAVFDSLPIILDGLGFITNYTYVDSEQDYEFNTAELDEPVEFVDSFQNISDNQYNITIYYEKGPFQTRISGMGRSEYIENANANRNGNLFEISDSYQQYDFSASYEITDSLTASLEVINLTDEKAYSYLDKDAKRLDAYDSYGRNTLLGVRYTF